MLKKNELLSCLKETPAAKAEATGARPIPHSDPVAISALSRHRGLIHAYEFAVDQLAFQSALPVCRSSCDTMASHNYDLALAFPYDSI